MEKCDHTYSEKEDAIEKVCFYNEETKRIEVDYEFCALCGKRFVVQ